MISASFVSSGFRMAVTVLGCLACLGSAPQEASSASSETYDFKVFLGKDEIGRQRFDVSTEGERTRVRVEAQFAVKESELVEADGAVDVEDNAAGVLADGLGLGLGQGDVLLDDLHRAGGDGPLLLALQGIEDGLMHIIRYLGRGAADKFQQRVLERIHRRKAKRVH